ncbi:hypothetical protein [Streptomyces sp. NPDC058694]|uniref:hypothetical protein n=1 Tax=Streptomyces sp. NPDC058694 TaxID=3346603 RepID=UPI00365D7854
MLHAVPAGPGGMVEVGVESVGGLGDGSAGSVAVGDEAGFGSVEESRLSAMATPSVTAARTTRQTKEASIMRSRRRHLGHGVALEQGAG